MNYCLCGLLLGLGVSALGQTSKCPKCTGSVLDLNTKEPIESATVYLANKNKFTTTNREGEFFFENVCSDTIFLTFSSLGYRRKNVTVPLKEDRSTLYYLEEEVESLEDVQVVENTYKESKKSVIEKTIHSDIIDKFTTKNLGDVLKNVSGVSSLNTGNEIVKPIINGLHSSRIIIMNNDVKLQDQEWGIEHAPSIDVNAHESISVIKGAGVLEYGSDAIGGVVVLNPFHFEKKDTLFGKVITAGHSNGQGFSVNSDIYKTWSKGWYVKGQGRYKLSGDYSSPNYFLTNTSANSKSFSFTSGFKSYDLGFDLYYNFIDNEIGILRASHIGNISDLVNAINSNTPNFVDEFDYDIGFPRQKVSHHLAKIKVYKRINDHLLNFQYSFQRNNRLEFDNRLGERKEIPAIDLELDTHNAKLHFEYVDSGMITFDAGVSGMYQKNYPNPDTGIRRFIPDYQKWELGVHGITKVNFNNSTFLDMSARYDYHKIDAQKYYLKSRWSGLGYENDFSHFFIKNSRGSQIFTNPVFEANLFSYYIGLNHQHNKNNWTINYSRTNRFPNAAELFSDGLHHSAARIELGSLRIQNETSSRVAASYTYAGDKIKTSLDVFYAKIDNFIFIEPKTIEYTLRGAFPVWEYRQNDATLIGSDFTFTYTIDTKWEYENKISFIKGDNIELNQPLIDMPPFAAKNSIRYQFKKGNSNFNIGAESEFVARQNRFPNNNFEQFIPVADEYLLVDISTPPQSYHIVNIFADVQLKKINLQVNVNNLFNVKYRNYLNRLRYFADDLGRNIIIQIKYNF